MASVLVSATRVSVLVSEVPALTTTLISTIFPLPTNAIRYELLGHRWLFLVLLSGVQLCDRDEKCIDYDSSEPTRYKAQKYTAFVFGFFPVDEAGIVNYS